MGTYPASPRGDFLAWCEAHYAVFLSNAASIGLTTAQANEFKTAVLNARNLLSAADAAKFAYRTAVTDTNVGFTSLRAVAGNTVRLIRAFAENSSNPNAVYSLAQIPPPATPAPAPPPGTPTNLAVRLDSSDGTIIVSWKCTNPAGTSGTTYVVRRRLLNTDPWTVIGITGTKSFVDDTFFAGPDSVQYTVFAQRAGVEGVVSEILTVNFGRPAGGGLTILSAQREAA